MYSAYPKYLSLNAVFLALRQALTQRLCFDYTAPDIHHNLQFQILHLLIAVADLDS